MRSERRHESLEKAAERRRLHDRRSGEGRRTGRNRRQGWPPKGKPLF